MEISFVGAECSDEASELGSRVGSDKYTVVLKLLVALCSS